MWDYLSALINTSISTHSGPSTTVTLSPPQTCANAASTIDAALDVAQWAYSSQAATGDTKLIISPAFVLAPFQKLNDLPSGRLL